MSGCWPRSKHTAGTGRRPPRALASAAVPCGVRSSAWVLISALPQRAAVETICRGDCDKVAGSYARPRERARLPRVISPTSGLSPRESSGILDAHRREWRCAIWNTGGAIMAAAAGVDPSRWYAVQPKARQEARAEANLRRWGLETLAPRLREPRPSRSGESFRVTPLFPNYLFARFDAANLLGKVRLTRGIRRVVGFGEYATPLDDSIIASIRSRVTDDGIVRSEERRVGKECRS